MKKLLLASILVVAFSAVHAQHAKFGIRLGASNTGYSGMDYDSDDELRKWSPMGGFYINSMVSDYFWIKTEFNFVNRGVAYMDDGKKLRSNFYYVDAYPLCPAFHFEGAQLFAGPSISFLASSTSQYLDDQGRVRTEADTELEGFNRLDIGFVAGIEYEFNFGLNLGFRYVKGFSSLFEPMSGVPRFEMFNNAMLITIGYTIGRND